MLKETRRTDPELASIMDQELDRQIHNIEMIASESTVPVPVMELSGSVFTNKTLEGYPGARFQAGSHIADKLEILANERAKELFGAEHVNLQTYSGSTANYSVFASVLNPGDKILSMSLDHGGHLTHGSPVNWTSKIYNHDFYGVDKDSETINYDALEQQAMAVKPKLIIAGGSSYPRLIDYERIADIASKVEAYFMVDMAHIAGLVAAGVIPSPIPYADFVTSSTTKTFCSARSGMVFSKEKHKKLLDKGTFPGSIGSTHLHTMAANAWSMKYAGTEEFKNIMSQVLINAKTLANALQQHGFRMVSGGTDNHLLVVDLRDKGLTGKEFQAALDYVGITVNKNMIPFDPATPFVTSGVRIGLTCVTQRGLKEAEIVQIGDIMNRVAINHQNQKALDAIREEGQELIGGFPLYNKEFIDSLAI